MASAQQLANTDSGAANETNAPPTRRMYRRYLLFALIIPLILWCSAFPLVCSRSYEDWGETQWGPVLEFPYQANTPDADVVIFGDSSAFLGIDPLLINKQLGIHSVVIPSTVGSLPVMGDAPLRSYLSRHKRPRLIVLYFSPWNLDFSHTAPGRRFEGEEMMLRHGSSGEILRYELLHPIEFVAFPLRMFSTFGSKMLVAILHHKNRVEDTASGLGHTPYPDTFGPLPDICRIPTDYLKQTSDKSVQELKRRYDQPGIQVMVYMAPIPNCTNSGAVHSRSFADLGAAPPKLLPPTYFAGDAYYAHIRPVDVPRNSEIFAGVLQQELQTHLPDLLGGEGATAALGSQSSK